MPFPPGLGPVKLVVRALGPVELRPVSDRNFLVLLMQIEPKQFNSFCTECVACPGPGGGETVSTRTRQLVVRASGRG